MAKACLTFTSTRAFPNCPSRSLSWWVLSLRLWKILATAIGVRFATASMAYAPMLLSREGLRAPMNPENPWHDVSAEYKRLYQFPQQARPRDCS